MTTELNYDIEPYLTNVYLTESALYVTNEDGHLVEISGEEKDILATIIERFQLEKDKKVVFNQLKDEVLNDQGYFDLLLDYLLENKILKYSNSQRQITKNIAVFGVFPNPDEANQLIQEALKTEFISYKATLFQASNNLDESIKKNILDSDLVIIFSPIILNFNTIQRIGEFCDLNHIPILHVSSESSGYTVGPLLDSKQNTASLNCYFQRKLAALKDPKSYIVLKSIETKKQIQQNDCARSRYFKIILELIKIELSKYFVFHSNSLLSKEIRFDGVSYETSVTKILKVQNPTTTLAPFND